jgi:hypothetical protein
MLPYRQNLNGNGIVLLLRGEPLLLNGPFRAAEPPKKATKDGLALRSRVCAGELSIITRVNI